jgi:hypothetical protein
MSLLHVWVFGVCTNLTRLLSVDGFAWDQAVTNHVYRSLTLFEDYIAD